jgi:nucleotide-binding universal stress UspA family protein
VKETTERPVKGSTHLVSDPDGVRYELIAVGPRVSDSGPVAVEAPHVVAQPQRTGGRIVVGIDGSDASTEALRQGIRIAKALGTSVQAVTTWRSGSDTFDGDDAIDWAQEDARQILEDASISVFGVDAPDWFTSVALKGYPEKALIEASKGAEMLVVGSRGHGGLAGVLLGSVSARCAERASCPVLVVH